jgi:hypothetical protein
MSLQGLYYDLVMSQEDKADLVLDTNSFLEEEKEMGNTLNNDVDLSVEKTRSSSRARLISEGSLDDTIKHDQDTAVASITKPGTLWRLWRLNFKEWPYLIGVVICTTLKGLQLPVYAYIFGRFIQVQYFTH